MSRFAPALRRTARELDLPRSTRAEILLEMAADLEAAYQHHRTLGATEDEAAARAEEAILGSSEVVRRLSRLHRSSLRSWSEHLGSRLHGGTDLVMLLVGVAPMLLLAGVIVGGVLLRHPTLFALPLIGIGLALTGLVAVEAGRIIGGGRGGRGELPTLIALSAAAPAVGMLALATGLYSVSGTFGAAAPEAIVHIDLIARIGRDAALFAVGLLLGLAGALSWFVLVNRLAVAADREVQDLLAGEGLSGGTGRSDVIPLTRRRRA